MYDFYCDDNFEDCPAVDIMAEKIHRQINAVKKNKKTPKNVVNHCSREYSDGRTKVYLFAKQTTRRRRLTTRSFLQRRNIRFVVVNGNTFESHRFSASFQACASNTDVSTGGKTKKIRRVIILPSLVAFNNILYVNRIQFRYRNKSLLYNAQMLQIRTQYVR